MFEFTFYKYKNLIDTAYINAENNISKITPEIISMEGMSGTKTRHFYNNLLNSENIRYLEIGTWKGSSVCSAMCGNKNDIVCIDNWSEFGGPKNEFIENFTKFKGENNAIFIEKDCFSIDTRCLPKFNIYMYDGNHTSDSHYKALLHYYECLDDMFIYIVDDWNWYDVRNGTKEAIQKLNLTILYEKEIILTSDGSTTPEPLLSQTWWNGIYIVILQKNNSVLSLSIDYKSTKTELCEIGKKYDTDKSSQRTNVSDIRHCHPYTIFYDAIFNERRNDNLNIGEFGILDGASLLMWQEYFPNASIYGFEYNNQLIINFKEKYNNDRIYLSYLDVKNEESINLALDSFNVQYDIIIEDTTHQFEDQIRAIENSYKYLKPGGMLIIEDIFKSYNENDYIKRLTPILHNFQDYYFITLDHSNRNSIGWDNDKLFVLIKNGSESIFKSHNKITIITPSYRFKNLVNIKKSINFDYVNEWLIIYDGNKIKENPRLFKNDNKIKEYLYKDEDSKWGNSQRNFALTKITTENTFIYYLDDDNIVHPNLYRILDKIHKNKLYSFNQYNRIKGNNICVGGIDTAMMLLDYNLYKEIRWLKDIYEADGYYLTECYNINTENHIYINNDICFYNYFRSS